jgi:hypothetical protein
MTTMLPIEPAPFVESPMPVMRCRRYLFDRADFQDDPGAPFGEVPASGRSAPTGPDSGLEREQ